MKNKKNTIFIDRPLIPGFKATTYFKAFVLNALATALIAIIAITTKDALDKDPNLQETTKGFIAFLAAFISAFVTYVILYMLFHFGGGMLAS